MNLAKARQISESLHKLILYQILTDDDLVKIGKIFIRALERAEKIAIKQHPTRINLLELKEDGSIICLGGKKKSFIFLNFWKFIIIFFILFFLLV